jgi:carbon-monoxide dehydrogenase medium subunit
MVVPLYAYKAVVRVSSARGLRTVPISDFVLGPRKTALLPDEMITSVFIPKASLDVPQIFLRHDQRGATDISIVSVAFVVNGHRDRIEWANAAVGAANPTPFTVPEQEERWMGHLNSTKLAEIADKYADRSNPISDVRASADYRKALVKVYIQRAAKIVLSVE